jgi:hypothetical protein
LKVFLGIGRGWGKGVSCPGAHVAFGEASFDFDYGGGEEDGFLLEAG